MMSLFVCLVVTSNLIKAGGGWGLMRGHTVTLHLPIVNNDQQTTLKEGLKNCIIKEYGNKQRVIPNSVYLNLTISY